MNKKETVAKEAGILRVSTTLLVKTLRALLKDPTLVPCVFGPAGIGKSSITYQIAEADFANTVVDTRLGQMQEEDMTGIPTVDGGRTIYNVPFFFPSQGKGIWFFDEVNRAKKGMLQCLFQLVLDRKYFYYTLPEGWRMLFAGNWSPEDAIYSVEELDPALRSRMCMLYYTGPTYAEWKSWAIPAGVAHEVVSFLGIHQQLLVTEPKDEKPSPNPRTWEKASNVLRATDDYDARRVALSGYLGLESAVMLLNYIEREYAALPDPADLKKAASTIMKWAGKKENDKIQAFVTSIIDYVDAGGSYDKMEMRQFVKQIPREFAFALLKGLNETAAGGELVQAVFDEETFALFEVE